MLEELLSMWDYPFMVRAFLVGLAVSAVAPLLGLPIVLRRLSMIGDGLSHVGFGAMSAALALGAAPLLFALPCVVGCAFILLSLRYSRLIKGDAAIALLSTAALAAGVMILSLSEGMNTDVLNYLFGTILGTSEGDAVISLSLCAAILACYIALCPRIMALTFDPRFARASGLDTRRLNFALALMTALVIVLGMRMMGALLITAVLVVPPLAAMRLARTFLGTLVGACAISCLSFCLGLAASFLWSTPAGASVVAVNLAMLLICHLAAALLRRLGRA